MSDTRRLPDLVPLMSRIGTAFRNATTNATVGKWLFIIGAIQWVFIGDLFGLVPVVLGIAAVLIGALILGRVRYER